MSTRLVASLGTAGEEPNAGTLLVGGESQRVVEALATRLAQRFEPLTIGAVSDLTVTLEAVGVDSVDTALVTTNGSGVLDSDPIGDLLADPDVVVATVVPPDTAVDPPETATVVERRGEWLPRLESWLRLQLDALDVEGSPHTSVEPRKQYERMLERQNDRLKEFTGVISHDLRNPLGVIVDRAELARATGEEAHLDAIVDTAQEMEVFLDDLLELARQGTVVADPGPVALDTVARRAWTHVATPDARLVIDDPATVVADESRLCQLLENLFGNAVEHGSTSPDSQAQGDANPGRVPADGSGDGATPAGVTVTVGSMADGFYVADDGPGIPPAERGEVFDHGYTTSDDGTGFGLSIVESVAGAHGWEVALAPPEASDGARFEITGVEMPGDDA